MTNPAAPSPSTPSVRVALMVRIEARPERAAEVAALLRDGQALVAAEPGTAYWFAVRLGPTTFGIFDAFGDDAARQAHLDGELAAALVGKASELLAAAPVIERVDVLGTKHAPAAGRGLVNGLVARIEAKPAHADAVGALIARGPSVVAREPGTLVWFGIRVDAVRYAIFDAFASEAARDVHLGGELANALVGQADALLARPPVIEKADVLAAKLP